MPKGVEQLSEYCIDVAPLEVIRSVMPKGVEQTKENEKKRGRRVIRSVMPKGVEQALQTHTPQRCIRSSDSIRDADRVIRSVMPKGVEQSAGR